MFIYQGDVGNIDSCLSGYQSVAAVLFSANVFCAAFTSPLPLTAACVLRRLSVVCQPHASSFFLFAIYDRRITS